MKVFVSFCAAVLCGMVLWIPAAHAATGHFELEITPLECTTDTVYDGLRQLRYAYPAECTRVIELVTGPYTSPGVSSITGTPHMVPVLPIAPGIVLGADVFPHVRALSIMDTDRAKEPVMALGISPIPPGADHPGGRAFGSNRLVAMLVALGSILLAVIIGCIKRAWR